MRKAFMGIVGGVALAILPHASALAGPALTPVVSTEWLERNLGAADLLILDIRSQSEVEAARIPGSHRTAYPGEWSKERDGIPGRIPLTTDLEVYLGGIGVGPGVSVVIVPAGTSSSEIGGATWIYWVLKYLGHDAVAILDGGWAAWEWEAHATESGPEAPAVAATFVASPRPELLAETDYVASRLGTDTVLVDARPKEHYTGAIQHAWVTRPGHIAGAVSLDNARFYDDLNGRFKAIDGVRAELPPQLQNASAEVITYCIAGHWGSIDWFVLHELAGFQNARLYEGSMAAWSRGDGLPMNTGESP